MLDAEAFAVSDRARASFQGRDAWDLMEKVKLRPQYDAEKEPNGVINLSGASNSLMDDWMTKFVKENANRLPLQHALSYGAVSGALGLLTAMAAFFNNHFHPSEPISWENVIAANGVTSLIDLIAWNLCDPGDAIVYPTPTFYMLKYDITVRSGVQTVPVTCFDIRDPFAASCVNQLIAKLEAAIDVQEQRGVRCRVLFICNPANPQGRCYSPKSLSAMAALCARRGMHLVADEIYAMSQFNPAAEEETAEFSSFASVLSIPVDNEVITLANIHCLYGMSKDFNMGGLRMAFLVSRNKEVVDATNRVTWFTWLTTFSATFVENFMSQPAKVAEYITQLHVRLNKAYGMTRSALKRCRIPFDEANAGLFVFLDLSRWIDYFTALDSRTVVKSDKVPSREIQLCEWLVDHGVFLNAGEFAESEQPGHFRLVFTEDDTDVVVLAIERIRKALDALDQGKLHTPPSRIESIAESDESDTLVDDMTIYSYDKEEALVVIGKKKTNNLSRLRQICRNLACFK